MWSIWSLERYQSGEAAWGLLAASWQGVAELNQRLDEMTEFLLHAQGVVQRLCNLRADDDAKAFSQAVDHHFDRTFGETKLPGGISLRTRRRVTHEPRFEGVELVQLSRLSELLPERGQRTVHDGQSPFTVEVSFASGRGGIGDLETG